MKKEKRKVQILRRMTEGDIKNLGGNMWMRRRVKWLIAMAFGTLAWMIVGANILVGFIGVAVSLLPILVLCLVFIVRMDKEGKKFWNKVKDKEQPVDLG